MLSFVKCIQIIHLSTLKIQRLPGGGKNKEESAQEEKLVPNVHNFPFRPFLPGEQADDGAEEGGGGTCVPATAL